MTSACIPTVYSIFSLSCFKQVEPPAGIVSVRSSSPLFIMREIKLLYYTIPKVLNIYSHPVNVNALNIVVSITVLAVRTPSCPIFFAIT